MLPNRRLARFRQRVVRPIVGIIVTAGVLVPISAFTATSPAAAYTTEGCTWTPFLAGNVNMTVGTEQPYAYYAAIAASNWDAAFAYLKIHFNLKASANNGTQGPIYEHASNFGNDGLAGVTYYTCSFYGWFNAPVNSYYNTYYDSLYIAQQDENTIGHEFGHAMGLDHSNTGSSCSTVALMYKSDAEWDNCGYVGPRGDDDSGMAFLYGSG